MHDAEGLRTYSRRKMAISPPFHFMPEIEDTIFEHAARGFPAFAPTLSCISRRVNARVERIIYRTLVLRSKSRSQAIYPIPGMAWTERIGATLDARPAGFFATHVQNVFMDATVPDEVAELVLKKCTGIKHLALWRRDKCWAKFITPLFTTLRTLFTHRPIFESVADTGVVFPYLNHIAALSHSEDPHLPSLEWAPALTVVRFDIKRMRVADDPQWIEDTKSVLTCVSGLQKLVLDVNSLDEEDVVGRIDALGDSRVLLKDSARWISITEWRKAWGDVDSESEEDSDLE